MGKYIIFLASYLLLFLQVFNAEGQECYGSPLDRKGSYAQNRLKLFSSLADKVVSSGGFYNASQGQYPNRVHVLGLCTRGYKQVSCINCINKVSQYIHKICLNSTDSFVWGNDDEATVYCLVRSSNNSTFGNLEVKHHVVWANPDGIEASKDMTLFMQQWEATVNQTLEAATKAEASSVIKYYSAVQAEFTEFPNVHMLMQCTPDVTPRDCKQCLTACLAFYRNQYRDKRGGSASFPSCFFRWDLHPFPGAFVNGTRFPAPPRPHTDEKGCSITHKKERSIGFKGIITAITVPTFINIVVFIGLIKCYSRRRNSNNGISVGNAEYSDSDGQLMLRYDLGIITTATDNFSPECTLGQGGFGTVYKGTLPNGKEIAVKRLTAGSGQGDVEFKNEVSLLTRLQHRNLVKLLGFCSERQEAVLVYEFVPNSSLDHFIFDEEKRTLLTWEIRCRIIDGIARGLLYLHEDSQLKIIHRDLKASNILLDAEMNPKVADFGTARLFDTDETRVETKRIAGTRGYMAPEYLNLGQISAKSDVYGFGVMLLEIISGEINNSFEGGLGAFAWRKWVEGKPETIIDHFLIDEPRNEIIRFIQIGLLCVQENAAKRPTMSCVLLWVGSETINIPSPQAPAFTGNLSQSEDGGTMSSVSNFFTDLSSR